MEKIIMRTEDIRALKACIAGPKDSRASLECINITKDYIEATDGKIVLRVDRDTMSECPAIGPHKILSISKAGFGLSEVILERYDCEYPNVDRIIPVASNSVDIKILHIASDKKELINLSSVIIKLYIHTGNAYSGHLLGRLAGLDVIWDASKAGTDKPLRLDAKGYTAVVCPFQL